MIDRTQTGTRCYTVRFIRTVKGDLRRGSYGTVLQACKRLMKRSSREQIEQAMKVEGEEFASRVRSAEAREAFTVFFAKRPPNFTRTKEPTTAK